MKIQEYLHNGIKKLFIGKTFTIHTNELETFHIVITDVEIETDHLVLFTDHQSTRWIKMAYTLMDHPSFGSCKCFISYAKTADLFEDFLVEL